MFKKKKLSPIERRLEELQKEMSNVSRDLKSVSRAAPAAGVKAGVKPPPFQDKPTAVDGMGGPPSAPPAAPGGLEPGAGDLFEYASKVPANPGATGELFAGLPTKGLVPPRAAAPQAGIRDQRSGREKFAHYFMAGHFPNLRPSRQESRVLRNKAIIMLIAAALAAAWLLYYLHNH